MYPLLYQEKNIPKIYKYNDYNIEENIYKKTDDKQFSYFNSFWNIIYGNKEKLIIIGFITCTTIGFYNYKKNKNNNL